MQTHIHRTIQWWGGGILAAFIVVCIAWFSREESPLLWDAGSFYLAAADYNITQDRPHLPGYYLHIYAVRFSRIFFSPGSAGVALSILWAAVAVLLLHRVLIRYYTPKTALISALLFATNPMLLFFASLSETYTFDAFFGIALFACFTIRHRTSFLRWELLSLPLMAFALGYRATSVFLVAPLAAVLWWRYYQSNEKTVVAKQFALSLFIAIAVMLLWLIPMMNDCGGVASYIALYSTHNPVMKSSIIQNAVTMMSYSLYAGTALVVLWIAGLKVPLSNDPPLLPRIPLLLWLWIPLILFVIGFYGKGYALLCIPAACLLLHPVVARRLWLAGVLIVLQCMAYGFAPYHIADASISFKSGNVVMKAIERATTVYSLSRNHIVGLNTMLHETDTLLPAYLGKLIVVDPSFPLPARALQVRYPHHRFGVVLIRDGGAMQVHSGISISITDNVVPLLDSAVILSTPSMCVRYAQEDAVLIDSTTRCRVLRVKDARRLYKQYGERFFR